MSKFSFKAIKLGFLAVVVLAVFRIAMIHPELISGEAVVYDRICGELLNNTTEGRQALVSSVWWPPLCSLFRLPAARFFSMPNFPVASVVTSIIFGLLLVWRINKFLRNYVAAPKRTLLLAALVLNPLFMRWCASGSSVTIALFLFMLGVESCLMWLSEYDLKRLVYCAISGALLTGVSIEMSLCFLLIFFGITVDVFVKDFVPAKRQATLIILFLPVLYAISLWILLNWLVMGDALYFLRSVSLLKSGIKPSALPAEAEVATYAVFAGAFVLAVLGLIGIKMRGKWLLIFLPTIVFGVAAAFFKAGLVWEESPLAGSILPLSIVTAGIAFGNNRHKVTIFKGIVGWLPAIASVALLCYTLLSGVSWTPIRKSAENVPLEERTTWLMRLEKYVIGRSRYARMFVCGYDAFLLTGKTAECILLPSLDFNVDKVRRDYFGQDIYVLLRCPAGRSAMESVNWKYNMIYTLGAEGMLYDGDWGDWRLYEVVQAPDNK